MQIVFSTGVCSFRKCQKAIFEGVLVVSCIGHEIEESVL